MSIFNGTIALAAVDATQLKRFVKGKVSNRKEQSDGTHQSIQARGIHRRILLPMFQGDGPSTLSLRRRCVRVRFG
jgi:hypothetical protein